MTWIFLTLLAAVLEAIGNVYDRFVLKNRLKNSDLLLILWGFFAPLMFCAPALITNSVTFNPVGIGLGLVSAALYLAAMHYYYKAVDSGEISRVVPILSINPIIVLILATLFLGETHQPIQYLGVSLIMIGIFIHAIDREHHRLIKKTVILWATLAALAFAIKNIFAKWTSISGVDSLDALFWIGLGILIFNIPITLILRKKVHAKNKRAIPDIALAAALAASITLIYTAAIIIGPAGLVAFLHRIEILFVFIISEIMDFFNPRLLREKFTKFSFYQKLLGVLIVLAGSYFLI